MRSGAWSQCNACGSRAREITSTEECEDCHPKAKSATDLLRSQLLKTERAKAEDEMVLDSVLEVIFGAIHANERVDPGRSKMGIGRKRSQWKEVRG